MNYKYDVSIIIVNYNGKRYIDTLFKSLYELELDDIKLQIIFVDNASSDDSVDYLEQNYNSEILKIVKSKENTGFAGGNNLGVKNSDGRYIVFLNNDTKVDKQWIKTLYNRIKDDNTIGMINSKLLFFYDFIKINTKTNDKFKINKKIKINSKEYEVDNKFAKNLLLEDRMTCFGHSYFYIPLLDNEVDYEFEFELSEYNRETDYILIDENKFLPDEKGIIRINIGKEDILRHKKTLIQNAPLVFVDVHLLRALSKILLPLSFLDFPGLFYPVSNRIFCHAQKVCSFINPYPILDIIVLVFH